MASGFASVGAGVGMMLFPPLIRFLHDHYSWRELLVYMSCLYMQVCVFGAFMRPLPKRREGVVIADDVIEIDSEMTDEKSSYDVVDTVLHVSDVCTDVNDVPDYSDIQSGNDNCSCDNNNITSVEKLALDQTVQLHRAENGYSLIQTDPSEFHQSDEEKQTAKTNSEQTSYTSLSDSDGQNQNGGVIVAQYDVISKSSDLSSMPECHCSNVGLYYGTCCSYAANCACAKLNIQPHSNRSSKIAFASQGFVVFCMSIFFFGLGLSVLYVHLSAFAMSHGAHETESSFLVTLLGVSSIFSRIITGIAGELNHLPMA